MIRNRDSCPSRIGRRSEYDAVSDRCEECDAPISAEEWHPVTTERGDDGEVRIRNFCSEQCRSAWDAERD
jgi:hypothetical protein